MMTIQTQETPEQQVALKIIAAWKASPELRKSANDEIGNFLHSIEGFTPEIILKTLGRTYIVNRLHH